MSWADDPHLLERDKKLNALLAALDDPETIAALAARDFGNWQDELNNLHYPQLLLLHGRLLQGGVSLLGDIRFLSALVVRLESLGNMSLLLSDAEKCLTSAPLGQIEVFA